MAHLCCQLIVMVADPQGVVPRIRLARVPSVTEPVHTATLKVSVCGVPPYQALAGFGDNNPEDSSSCENSFTHRRYDFVSHTFVCGTKKEAKRNHIGIRSKKKSDRYIYI